MKGITKTGIASALLLLGAFNAVAQESAREFTVDFPVGSSRLDLTWGANGRSIYKLTSFLRSVMDNPKMKINDITVYGTASPEGNADFNRRLALKRRDALRDVIIERAMVPDSVFTLQNEYIQWGLLRGMIKQCDAPWRDKAVAAIDENYVSSAGFETSAQVIKALKRIDGGRVWKELLVEYFPQMRNASAVVVTFEQLPAFREEYIEIPVDTAVPEPEPEPEPEIVVYEEPEHRCFYMDIRTDMLYDAALVPNLGVDFYLGRNISVGGNWQYAWWSKDSRHRYWRLYGGDINARWWFGSVAHEKPLSGHHLGVYAQMLTYDFEFGDKGYMAGKPGGNIWERASWGAGVEYGFSLPIARYFNIDFTLGVGYLGGTCLDYRVIDDHYVWQATKRRHWFGPTKAEISLVWLLGNGNVNTKKEKGADNE